jgi:peptidoglycan/LPS O-acetylase OafA/YrhL
VEEQFYLIIPLALVALVRARISIPWSLGAATLISFTLSMILTGFDQAAAFYLPFTRFWELAVGGLLAYVTLHHREHVARLQHWTLALAGLLIIATAVKITPFSFFPGWWAIPPVLGTTLVIAAGSATALNRILAWRPLVAIGLISYPLYLWHWPLLVLFRKDYPFARGFILSVVTGSVLLAAATYLLIERPLRNLPLRSVSLGGLGAMTAVAIIAAATVSTNGLLWGRNLHLPPIFLPVPPPLYDDHTDRTSGNGLKVLLWGDSHAGHLLPGFQAVRDKHPIKIYSLSFSDCPPT